MRCSPDEVRDRLRRFLERRSVPLVMRGNDRAIQDELTALLNIIVKFAPGDPEQFDEWWARLEAEIGKINATRSWPSEGEVFACCQSLVKKSVRSAPSRLDWDELSINVERIHKREPVGDYWVRGGGADRLLRAGLISTEDLEPYLNLEQTTSQN